MTPIPHPALYFLAFVVAAACGWGLAETTDGRTTLRCETVSECNLRADARCGKDRYKLWGQRHDGHPRRWLGEAPYLHEIECTPDRVTNSFVTDSGDYASTRTEHTK